MPGDALTEFFEREVSELLDREWVDFRKWSDVYPDWEQDLGSPRPLDAAGNEVAVPEPRPGGTADGGWVLPQAMLDDFELYFEWRQVLEPDMAEQIPYTNGGEVWAYRAVSSLMREGLVPELAYTAYCEWNLAAGGFEAGAVDADTVYVELLSDEQLGALLERME